MNEGWKPFSFKNNWIEFITLNEPSLRAYHLPAVPGDVHSKPVKTIATETVLVTNRNVGLNAVYKLAATVFQNKLELFHNNIMYRAVKEEFDKQSLLYPLHEGTTAFLNREQPTFLERYADTIALIFSIIAVIYGTIQTIRNRIARKKRR
ncbi:MAG: TAXI family TRAP transporter solute-binding subunit [Cytophagales bacterium]|nr:TAXI family TRAP transporter solute-binding subunit [Cytophagales bacterium]